LEIEFDPAKDATNQATHGLSLADAERMNLGEATVSPDTRFAYGENRYRAWGLIDGVLHVMAFTLRNERVRVISLRKANSMENRRYG
jgi:uncharacterized DUF497 family protein